MYATFIVSQHMFMTWWCYLSYIVRQQTDNYGISRIIAALKAIRSHSNKHCANLRIPLSLAMHTKNEPEAGSLFFSVSFLSDYYSGKLLE